MSHRFEQATHCGVTEPHGCRGELVHDGGVQGGGVRGASIHIIHAQPLHGVLPQDDREVLRVRDVLDLSDDNPPRLLVDDLVLLSLRLPRQGRGHSDRQPGRQPVVLPHEERVERGQGWLDDGPLVPGHQVARLLRRAGAQAALLSGGQAGPAQS